MIDKGKQKIFLKDLANNILNEARTLKSNRIFSATGFSKKNISIIHQQKRCENLSWALKYRKKIKRGDVIGIIGGSFSGIALASFLAIANDVIVYIFEKEDVLLKKFLNSGNRYLSPNLNSRELGLSFNPEFDSNTFQQILFDWDAGLAHNVVNQWLKEFSEYEKRLPIFCFLNKPICQTQIKLEQDKIIVNDSADVKMKPIILDILIDATGFGEEINPHQIKDYSYWQSGHKLIYDHLGKNDKVLISGVGDSGIIEVLQYALKDFEHRHILWLWQHRTFEADIDTQRPQAVFDNIFEFHDIELDQETIFPEIAWWLSCKWSSEMNPRDHSLDRDESQIFSIIENALSPILKLWASSHNITAICYYTCRYFIQQGNLSIDFQSKIRQKIEKKIDELSSIRLKRMMDRLDIRDVLNMQTLSDTQRQIQITYNGLSPTPYTINLSPYNLWLTKIAMSIPIITYKKGKIRSASQDNNGIYQVKYNSGKIETYNRVITRYGISKERNNFFPPNVFDPQKGDFMLNDCFYESSLGETYRDLIHRKRNQLIEKKKTSKNIIYKEIYKIYITAPIVDDNSLKTIKSNFPLISDSTLKEFGNFWDYDFQDKLSNLLKRGCSVSYASCDIKKKIIFTY